MHLFSVKNEDVLDFTFQRWNTYRTYLRKWLCLHGANKDLAETYKHCVDMDFENIPGDAGFHATRYRRFTDKQKLSKAENKSALAGGEPSATASHSDPPESTSEVAEASETPRKKLRSRSGLPIASAGPVLPAICIICKKVSKYARLGSEGKRQRDHLAKAETLSAGMCLRHARPFSLTK